MDRVAYALEDFGYYKASPRIANVIPVPNQSDTYDVVVDLQKLGPVYRVRELQFSGSRVFPTTELRKHFKFADGDIFNRTKVGEGLAAVRQLYGTKGYINFTSVPDTVDHGDNSITIKIDMDDGSQYRIASTTLLGIDEERSKLLLKGTGLEPGSIFDPSAIERFFAAHRDLVGELRPDAASEIRQNESSKTVTLIFDLRRCGE